MNKSRYDKTSLVVIVILVLLALGIGIFLSITEKVKDTELNILKSNAYNNYERVTILDSEMASLYFNDYYNLLINDIDKAYQKLDSVYRQNKFSTASGFLEYIRKLNIEMTIVSTSVEIVDNNYIYHVIVNPNVEFIFNTVGVMDYTVTIK